MTKQIDYSPILERATRTTGELAASHLLVIGSEGEARVLLGLLAATYMTGFELAVRLIAAGADVEDVRRWVNSYTDSGQPVELRERIFQDTIREVLG